MKTPRTFLSDLEEAGLRMARVVGTRKGELLLSEETGPNLALAKRLRELDWQIPELEVAMVRLASRIERRMYAAENGLIGIDRDGRMSDGQGHLVQTPESIAAAKTYYNNK